VGTTEHPPSVAAPRETHPQQWWSAAHLVILREGEQKHCLGRVHSPGPRGRPKKIDGPPRAPAKSQTHPPTIRFFSPLTSFLVRFWAFLGNWGVKKRHGNVFAKSLHVENFSQRNRQKFRCQFFLDFFWFLAFSGVSHRWELKKHYKKRFTK
jgi:hypothetical protein